MRDNVAESRCRVFDIGMQRVVVPNNIGVGGNQFLRYRDILDNGLSNCEVRKMPWVHGRAVLNLPIPIIAAVLVTEFDLGFNRWMQQIG